MLRLEEIGRTRLAALLRASKRLHAALDPAGVLLELRTLAAQGVDAGSARVYLLDEDREQLTYLDREGRATHIPLDAPGAVLVAHVIKRGETVNLADPAEDPRLAAQISARSALAVPLLDPLGNVSGAVLVLDKHEGSFSGEDERFLLVLGEEAALALANARQHAALTDDHDRLAFLYQVSKLTTAADARDGVRLRDVLLTVMNGVATLLKTEAASILLWDKRRRRLVFVTAAGDGDRNQGLAEIEVPLQGSIAGWAIQNKGSVLVNDVQGDPRFFPGADERTGFVTRNLICAPMELHGKIIGVLEALNKQDNLPFTETDLQLLQKVADHTAQAIEKARRYEDLLRVGELHQQQARAALLNPMNPLGR